VQISVSENKLTVLLIIKLLI